MDSDCSCLSIVQEWKQLAVGCNSDGRGFAVAYRSGIRNKISEVHVLLIGHFDKRHPFSGEQAMQEPALAILAARLVIELSSHDLWNDDRVRKGCENALSVRASVQVDHDARV